MEQKERQIKELQAQLSGNICNFKSFHSIIFQFIIYFKILEAVRKQHEAMSRAIMLAGDRTHNRETATKQAGVEKKVVGLESERNVLKQMLATTQKERDELMKEVHRLHSQGILQKQCILPLIFNVTHSFPIIFRISANE